MADIKVKEQKRTRRSQSISPQGSRSGSRSRSRERTDVHILLGELNTDPLGFVQRYLSNADFADRVRDALATTQSLESDEFKRKFEDVLHRYEEDVMRQKLRLNPINNP